MKIRHLFIIFTMVVVLGVPGFVFALPSLQLDIPGGTYNPADQTTYAAGDTFTLRALLNPAKDPLTETFYVSAALVTGTGAGTAPVGIAGSYGSFVFNGATVNATASMINGDPESLPSHGIFSTYYYQSALFTFTGTPTVPAYDVQTGASSPGVLNYKDFSVDTSNLANGYAIHFDLYTSATKRNGHPEDFAPFSHDAQSLDSHRHQSVPEPSTLLLLGGGLVGLLLWRKGKQSSRLFHASA